MWQSISPTEDTLRGSHSQEPDSKTRGLMPVLHDSIPRDSIPRDSIPCGKMTQDATAFVATPCCNIDVLELHPVLSSLAEDQEELMSPLAHERDPNLQDHSLHAQVNCNNNMNNSLPISSSHSGLLADLQLHLPSSSATAVESHTENTVTVMNTSDHLTIRIFPELDALLDQTLEPDPEGIFEPSRMIISKVESLSGSQELLEYDDILDSESVALNLVGGSHLSRATTETAQTAIESGQTRLTGSIASDSVAPAETAQTDVEPSQTCLSSLIAPNSGLIATDATRAGMDSGQACLSGSVPVPALSEQVIATGLVSLQPGHLGVKMEPEMGISIESEIEVVDLKPVSLNVSIENAGTCLTSSEPGQAVSQTSTEASQTDSTGSTAQLGTPGTDPGVMRRRIVRAKRKLQRKQTREDQKEPVDPSSKQEVVALKTGQTVLDLAEPEKPVGKRPRPVSRSKSGRILKPSWKISTPNKKTTLSQRTKHQSPAETPPTTYGAPPEHLTVDEDSSNSCLAATAPPDPAHSPPNPAHSPSDPAQSPTSDTPTLANSGSSFSMSLDDILKEMGEDSSPATAAVVPHAPCSTVPAAVLPTPSNGSKKIKRLRLTKKPSPLVLFSESAAAKQRRSTPDECSLVFDLDAVQEAQGAPCGSAVEDTHNLEVSLAPLDIEEPLSSLSLKQPPLPDSYGASNIESVEAERLPDPVEEPSSGKNSEGVGSSDAADKEERELCRNDAPVQSTDEDEREDIVEIFDEDYDRFTSYSCPANEKREAPPKMPTLHSPPSASGE